MPEKKFCLLDWCAYHTSLNLHIARDILVQYSFVLILFFCHIILPSLLSESWLPPFPSCTMLLPAVESLDLPTKTNNKYITERTSGFWGSQLWSPNIGDTYRCFSLYIFSTCSLNKSWHIPPCMAMQEPSVSFPDLASIYLFLQLQHTYPSSACRFTDLILYSGNFKLVLRQVTYIFLQIYVKFDEDYERKYNASTPHHPPLQVSMIAVIFKAGHNIKHKLLAKISFTDIFYIPIIILNCIVEQGLELLNVLPHCMWCDQYKFIYDFTEECPEDMTGRSWTIGCTVQQKFWLVFKYMTWTHLSRENLDISLAKMLQPFQLILFFSGLNPQFSNAYGESKFPSTVTRIWWTEMSVLTPHKSWHKIKCGTDWIGSFS